MMRTTLIFICMMLSVVICLAQDELKTRAELSDYTETSRNADVVAFAEKLVGCSNNVRFTYIGKSSGGAPIPLLILGNPAPASPAQLIGDGRLCVFIMANIHAGEVEGKEASLMLARDIALGGHKGLLDKLVILIAPNYNPDGNDKISPDNRAYQGGPETGVGLRANDWNLDLNRDWMKLESSEARAVVGEIFNKWDPALVVDCHTTNGSPHREPLTYAPPHNPSGDSEVMRYNRDVLIKSADERLLDVYGYESIHYGNFADWNDINKGWATFAHQPRYTSNYAGLRNRLSVLIETYAFADFQTRVLSTYGFLESLLNHCSENAGVISDLIKGADWKAHNRIQGLDPQRDNLALEVEVKPLPEPIEILGYEMESFTDERGRTRLRATEKEATYTLPHIADFVATRAIELPQAYLLSPGVSDIASKLLQHGIAVERLTSAIEIPSQKFTISDLKSEEYIYQGHRFTLVKGAWEDVVVGFPVGTLVVRTAQPLGMLAAYLLEPESDDGLVFWNFFDRHLTRQWGRGFGSYPVWRVLGNEPLPTELVRP